MAGRRPLLIFWQEILPGDLRKIEARSNDAITGGGARDLRFPDKAFRPVLEQMFREEADVKGRLVRRGYLVWEDPAGLRKQQEVEYWPPTDARPIEGRLARIHEIEPLGSPPDSEGDAVVLVLILDDAGDVRAYYATTDELRKGWHDEVAQPILECLGATRREDMAARGWLDIRSGDQYCHG